MLRTARTNTAHDWIGPDSGKVTGGKRKSVDGPRSDGLRENVDVDGDGISGAAAPSASGAHGKPQHGNLHYNAKKQRNSYTNVKPASQIDIFGALDPVADANKIASRAKQVSYGKNTLGYERYLAEKPLERRRMDDPWTPDSKANIPNKRWQGLLKKWRADLHKFDPEGLVPTTKSCAEAESLMAMMSGISGGDEKMPAAVDDDLKKAAEAGLVVQGVSAPAAKKMLSWGERNVAESEEDDVYAAVTKGGDDGLDSDSDDDLL